MGKRKNTKNIKIMKKELTIKEKIIEGLEPEKKKISINPPPKDRRCMCCDRHINVLKPFGKDGDPLVGNFDGALLVKTFRDFGGCISASWECRDCIVLNDEDWGNNGKKKNN